MSVVLIAIAFSNALAQGAADTAAKDGATAPKEAVALQLPARIAGTDWRATGSPLTLTAEQFAVHPDADLYREYGLKRSHARIYARGGARLAIESFETAYPSGAFGMGFLERAREGKGRKTLQRGQYLISLSLDNGQGEIDGETMSAVEQLLASVEASNEPPIIGHLPARDRAAGSERYILGPVALGQSESFKGLGQKIDFSGGTEIAAATYRNGGGLMDLILIEYHTPQAATSGHQTLLDHFNGLRAEEQQRWIVKRTGNYVIAAANVGDRAAAEGLINEIKYEMKVYWEGRKFSSIPLEFRPPDPAAIEEASVTATILLRTFYGIGMMLLGALILGAFSGWAVFYWRRQRRRKLGLDQTFSDAGDTVRLNLDDYVLPAGEQPIKLLGKGDA